MTTQHDRSSHNTQDGLVVGVIGATGLVGQTALDVLSDSFPHLKVAKVKAYASRSSVGKRLEWGSQTVVVEETTLASLRECDAVFLATESATALEWIPQLAPLGILCVDKSSAYRMDDKVPLVVPEVNGDKLSKEVLGAFPVVANPNCCATPLVCALQPLVKAFGVKRVVVSTYQSVSGAGTNGIEALRTEMKEFAQSSAMPEIKASGAFPKPIAFNVMPFVAKILESGDTDEEIKIVQEVKKILGLPQLPVSATSVRVPTFVGHAESVTIELSQKADPKAVAQILQNAPGLVVVDPVSCPGAVTEDGPQQFATPLDAQGTDPVFVSRIRRAEVFGDQGISLWLSADNLRKGAALNAAQILDACVAKGLFKDLKRLAHERSLAR